MDNKENAINMRRVNTPSVPPPQLTKTPIKVFGTGDDGPSPKLASTSKDSKNKTSTPVMLDVQTKQAAKNSSDATLTKLASPTTATVAGDFRDGNKMVNISSEDVLQVLMKVSRLTFSQQVHQQPEQWIGVGLLLPDYHVRTVKIQQLLRMRQQLIS